MSLSSSKIMSHVTRLQKKAHVVLPIIGFDGQHIRYRYLRMQTPFGMREISLLVRGNQMHHYRVLL